MAMARAAETYRGARRNRYRAVGELSKWRDHGWWKQANIAAGVSDDRYERARNLAHMRLIRHTVGKSSWVARAHNAAQGFIGAISAAAQRYQQRAQARQQARQMRRAGARGM